ncbi:phospholipase D family protein [Methylosinus sp. KRF6]|uniref:phospholipase D family protein n=1 Tax=Methylosinus sp. KRF6 TaxID=2846853 RepID=UPI001C0B07DE|nr:phospholipase D family protein [Methylosinus sp. KRF6]MBU3891069.1 phospholipase D family protein [Methylosinus sp. KRF6]
MQNRRSLDPEQRLLYGANLQPPAGYVFDAAVATTYSLDFETALAVPVSLALFAAEDRDSILSHPLALLEGAERIAGRLVVFTDAGHIQAGVKPHSHYRLCSLLERTVVEVVAPRGGAFHPKMWALRFKPLRPEDPARMRLLILSRNLTRDRSWDIAATLDGVITKQPKAVNRPIADFLRQIPDLATIGVPEGTKALVDELAEDVRRAEWTLPEPFESVSFAVNGFGAKPWFPERRGRLGVVSPFCDDETLSKLADGADEPIFIGRSDEIAKLDGATLDCFSRVAVLDEMAVTEDGEDVDATPFQGLHAKAFVVEIGWDTNITIGSGNATKPALVTGNNVEVFVTLTGKRSRVGSVEEILGEKGFGRLTRPFVRNETAVADAARRAAEARLEQARREICRSGLKLRCERGEPTADGAPVWRVWLVPPGPLPLAGIGVLRVWPITRGEAHERDVLEPLRQGQSADLGGMPLVDITRFLACHLTDETEDVSILFSTGLSMDGLPAGRHAAILRWVIDSKDAFFRYLRLLLSEFGDPFAAALAAQGETGHGAWRAAGDDAPILEQMVRAFCRGGDQLRAIERLIERLETDGADADSIPAEFRALWNTFRIALAAEDASNG